MTFNFDDLKFSVCPNFDRNAKIQSSQGKMLLLYPKYPQLHEKGANFSLLAYLHQKQPNLQVYIYSSKLYIDLYIQNFEMSIPIFPREKFKKCSISQIPCTWALKFDLFYITQSKISS